jgi:crossover junction endodeoxyribonuclease RuvC
MKVLGIDPGTLVTGYGMIESREDDLAMIECGTISGKKDRPIGERLNAIFLELSAVITRHRPDVIAVEQPFVAKNVRSAMAIGRAQAVALLAAAQHHIPAFEYTPTQIKRQVTNYGASDKAQIQEMVRLQLNLSAPPPPADAADALAAAICHVRETYVNRLLAPGSGR